MPICKLILFIMNLENKILEKKYNSIVMNLQHNKIKMNKKL
jgi:hypothetical protein